MTWTDRRWIGIVAIRQALIAWLFFADHERFEAGVSFLVVIAWVPILGWALLFAVSAVPSSVALFTGRPRWARVGIFGSLILSAYWTFGLAFAQVEARAASWLLAILWGALTLKDANLAFSGLGLRDQRSGV